MCVCVCEFFYHNRSFCKTYLYVTFGGMYDMSFMTCDMTSFMNVL